LQLRKGDYLKDFCELMNDATAPLRTEESSATDRKRDAA